jgi:hypothetical protein
MMEKLLEVNMSPDFIEVSSRIDGTPTDMNSVIKTSRGANRIHEIFLRGPTNHPLAGCGRPVLREDSPKEVIVKQICSLSRD